MKKMLALLMALSLLALGACGAETTGKEPVARGGMPDAAEPIYEEPEELDWDLAICQPEEVYREVEHYNTDPVGYRGLRLRLTGEFSAYEGHGKTFYYVGVRDEDGCIEKLELRFPGDGSLPQGFPAEGETVTVWGLLDWYSTQRDGKDVVCAVLTETRLSQFIFGMED